MESSNWDEMLSLKPASDMPPQTDEDLAYYLSEYKDFDNLFDEALTTLQDLDVPSGYGQATGPPQRSPRGSSKSHLQSMSHFRHSKKPSGTAIFGFLDHNREFSLGGAGGEDISRMMKAPQETVKSISPTQLARTTQPVISNEQLNFNFDEPLEACKPIHLKEEDEHPEVDSVPTEVKSHVNDMIVTNENPKSYKFPPEPPTNSERATFERFLSSSRPLPQIHHPKQHEQYPDDIDDLVAFESPKLKGYVPIPVREPMLQPAFPATSPTSSFRSPVSNTYLNQNFSSPRNESYMPHAPREHHEDSHHEEGCMGRSDALSMNMNVYLPPPSTGSSSQASPEPRSPSPQNHYSTARSHYAQLQNQSSPLRSQATLESSPLAEKRGLYNPQFFSDDADCYFDQPPSRFNSSSPAREFPQSSPIRQISRVMESHADDTIVDANETILQLTPLKNHAPITPRTNRITLEWSPIISPNGKATKDVRKAIQELSPKRTMKKTSLLPPGELDKYWEGPDEDKNFVCVYKNCGKKFTRRYNVRSHIQTHLSDRPFTCSYCPKSFVRQHDLNRHVKSHMISKHCRCKCGREFTRIEGYKKHLANGVCSRALEESSGGVSKPGSHRIKGETILDGLTSNRLNEELNLQL